MRFRGLDLNLLVAFDVLMQERSVSSAAKQFNLTQPAMSSALSRLREYFGDELLVSQGKRMHPTLFAETLLPHVRETLRTVEIALQTNANFDPLTAQRSFRLIASDYIVASLIVPMVERFSREAPNVRLQISAPSEAGEAEIAEAKVDLLIGPDLYIRGDHPTELLFEEDHVVVGWDRNPLMQAPVTEDAFFDAGHVAVRIGAQRQPAFADRAMIVMNRWRRIEVETSSFLTLPPLLCGTSRLALMQRRLADQMSKIYPLATAPIPFDFPRMREMMQFHRTRGRDPSLVWLRRMMVEVSQEDRRAHPPADQGLYKRSA